jgi:hypothetical protein
MDKLAPSKITALEAVREGRLSHLTADSKRAHGYFIAEGTEWISTRKANQPTYRFLEENGYIEVGQPGAIKLAPVTLTKKGKDAIKHIPKVKPDFGVKTLNNTIRMPRRPQ